MMDSKQKKEKFWERIGEVENAVMVDRKEGNDGRENKRDKQTNREDRIG